MRITFLKEGHRVVVSPLADGRAEITNDMYLTVYKKYGCESKRIVSEAEAVEIMKRLLNKGFRSARG